MNKLLSLLLLCPALQGCHGAMQFEVYAVPGDPPTIASATRDEARAALARHGGIDGARVAASEDPNLMSRGMEEGVADGTDYAVTRNGLAAFSMDHGVEFLAKPDTVYIYVQADGYETLRQMIHCGGVEGTSANPVVVVARLRRAR